MASYIQELRKTVGHRTLIHCAASTIVVDPQGRLLLGLRSDNRTWCYAGGAVEIDESVEDCARRELKEEMGLEAVSLEFFFINSGPQAHYIYPNGDEVSNVEIVYICRDYLGKPSCSDKEMLELRFFFPEEITADMVSPPVRPVIERYKKMFCKKAK